MNLLFALASPVVGAGDCLTVWFVSLDPFAMVLLSGFFVIAGPLVWTIARSLISSRRLRQVLAAVRRAIYRRVGEIIAAWLLALLMLLLLWGQPQLPTWTVASVWPSGSGHVIHAGV